VMHSGYGFPVRNCAPEAWASPSMPGLSRAWRRRRASRLCSRTTAYRFQRQHRPEKSSSPGRRRSKASSPARPWRRWWQARAESMASS